MKGTTYHFTPRSKTDRNLPYTYEAWVDILAGQGSEPIFDHFLSDTLCGLIECLDQKGIAPAHVRLMGVYRGEETRLDTNLCTDAEGQWLSRPQLCHVLEEHYEHTGEECYRGHVEKGSCSFEDRERKGIGPFW